MKLRSSTRALLIAGLLGGAHVASANPTIEIGVHGGIHGFSDENELGVFDMEGVASQKNAPLVGLRLGLIFKDLIGIEVEGGIVPTGVREMDDFSVTNLTYRGHLIAQYSKIGSGKVVPFIVGGVGAFLVTNTDDNGVIYKDVDAAPYGGLGAKYRLPGGWGLRGDARLMFPPSSQSEGATTDFELLLSFYKEFNRKENADKDPDRDGILNPADRCPTDPEDKDGFQDEDGCPENDNDSDGIVDVSDKCPMDPEDKDQFQDIDGCPDPDNDLDGIVDGSDRCPTDPEDKDSFEDEDGCPDNDNDKDGIADKSDKCPNQPETVNSFEDEDGCPDTVLAAKQFTGVIEGVTFKTASADILTVANPKLEQAVKVLAEYPALKLEIHGHTDDKPLIKGSAFADNQALSESRAQAVKDYLVKKGVAADRIIVKGFGGSKPVAPITAADGTVLKGAALENARAKNRRVELLPI